MLVLAGSYIWSKLERLFVNWYFGFADVLALQMQSSIKKKTDLKVYGCSNIKNTWRFKPILQGRKSVVSCVRYCYHLFRINLLTKNKPIKAKSIDALNYLPVVSYVGPAMEYRSTVRLYVVRGDCTQHWMQCKTVDWCLWSYCVDAPWSNHQPLNFWHSWV